MGNKLRIYKGFLIPSTRDLFITPVLGNGVSAPGLKCIGVGNLEDITISVPVKYEELAQLSEEDANQKIWDTCAIIIDKYIDQHGREV